MVAEWQRRSIPSDSLQHSMVREVSPPAMDGAELAVTPLSLLEGERVGIVLSLCDMLWLMLRTRDLICSKLSPCLTLNDHYDRSCSTNSGPVPINLKCLFFNRSHSFLSYKKLSVHTIYT